MNKNLTFDDQGHSHQHKKKNVKDWAFLKYKNNNKSSLRIDEYTLQHHPCMQK